MAGKIELVLTTEFKETYKKLPQDIKKKVRKQLHYLKDNPTHPSLQIHRLNDEYRKTGTHPILFGIKCAWNNM